MKKLIVPISAVALALICGCSLFQSPIPANKYVTQIGATKFSWTCPKDASLDSLDISVDTNGVFQVKVRKLMSVNNSGVIASSYAGQAEFVNALGTQFNNLATNMLVTGAKIGVLASPMTTTTTITTSPAPSHP